VGVMGGDGCGPRMFWEVRCSGLRVGPPVTFLSQHQTLKASHTMNRLATPTTNTSFTMTTKSSESFQYEHKFYHTRRNVISSKLLAASVRSSCLPYVRKHVHWMF